MDSHDWNFTLTPEAPRAPTSITLSADQQRISDEIVHGTTDLAVIAAAGSGKTTTVVESIHGLLLKGYDKKDILLLSFSRPAVNEINWRLAQLGLQPPPSETNAKDMMAQTFHARAGREMRRTYKTDIVDFVNGTRVLRERDLCVDVNWKEREKIWLDVLNTHAAEKLELREVDEDGEEDELDGLFNIKDPEHRKTVQRLGTVMARLTAVGIKISETSAVEAWLTGQELALEAAAWLADYDRNVAKAGLWTFADTIIDWYRSGPRHRPIVIVDEAQDMDPILLNAAMHIAKGGRLIAVGDIRQCVHVWKGADPSVFQAFADRQTTTTAYLNENRRSVKSIVDLGNTIMQPFPYGNPRATAFKADTLGAGWQRGASGAAYNPTSIVRMVELARRAKPGQQVAVLARTWKELQAYEFACFKAGLTYECKKRRISMTMVKKFKEKQGFSWAQRVDAFLYYNQDLADIGAKAKEFPSAAAFHQWADEYINGTAGSKAQVYLGTAHSSKGLTLHTVIIVTNTRWNKPDGADYEAERRLLYVAVTRAENSLFVYADEEGGYPDNL